MSNESRVIVALDYPEPGPALELAGRLAPGRCRLKVGKELFTASGPQLVERLVDQGFDIFLDLKYHDIPNTVAKACAAACRLGVWMVNVHALGGQHMLEAARDAVATAARRPKLIAVTVLTSLSDSDLHAIGLSGSAQDNVLRLAALAQRAGLDGVVCSPREVIALRAACGETVDLVTPGIRPQGRTTDDQRRTLTPGEAVQAGASFLVIGRPITAASDPMQALSEIEAEIKAAETVDA